VDLAKALALRVIVAASNADGKVALVTGVTTDLTQRVHAGQRESGGGVG
jgi:hypothetical protein